MREIITVAVANTLALIFSYSGDRALMCNCNIILQLNHHDCDNDFRE